MKPSANKVKTTFHVDESVLSTFIEYCNQIGLRRDRYLNSILPQAVSLLGRSSARNSTAAEILTKAVRDSQDTKLKKLVITVDAYVIQELNTVCANKRVPRDTIFEEILKCLCNGSTLGSGDIALSTVSEFLNSPWIDWVFPEPDVSPFDNAIIGDLSAPDLIAQLTPKNREDSEAVS